MQHFHRIGTFCLIRRLRYISDWKYIKHMLHFLHADHFSLKVQLKYM